MAFESRAYRILIASPSDVEEEREIAVRVIQEWNDLHSYGRKVVLLPLRWETHTAPEYGSRPQEIINRAIVDQCDLLVGVFWTRVGTPTGVADSGTIEEISRVASAGKPVMLYFSRVGIDPERVDLQQLGRLGEFKRETYPNALTDSYKSHIEFRDKFAKQLELKVRDLLIADKRDQPPPLHLLIEPTDPNAVPSSHGERVVELVSVPDLSAISTLGDEQKKRVTGAVEAYIRKAATVVVPLAVANIGVSGIRNLYGELRVGVAEGQAGLVRTAESLDVWAGLLISYRSRSHRLVDEELTEGFKRDGSGWKSTFEWDALQPQRTRVIRPALIVRAESDAMVVVGAKIYADSFPAPLNLGAKLAIKTSTRELTLEEALPEWRKIAEQSDRDTLVLHA